MQQQPRLTRIDRRRFFKLFAAGTGAAVVGAVSAVVLTKLRNKSLPGESAVPVQNPAFRAAAGKRPGTCVLFCYTGQHEVLAYELNQAAAAVWEHCTPYSSPASDATKNVAEIAGQLASRIDGPAVVEFISLLHAKGLVYFADSDSQVYCAYQDAS